MNQQPDKFFREKLEGYQRQAPAGAWDKIAAGQMQKNSRALWWKIAASFLVVALAAYLLWPTTQQQKIELTQTTDDAVQASPGIKPVPEVPQPEKQAPDRSLAQHNSTPKVKKNNKSNPVATSAKTVVTPQDNDEPTAQQELPIPAIPPVSSPENNVSMNADLELVQPQEQSNNTAPRITLTYTANDVSEYLDKKSLDEATSDDKKPSTLKKLLQKANDLKTNQDPFGELRQKKNEILALNFKSEKQRGQNK